MQNPMLTATMVEMTAPQRQRHNNLEVPSTQIHSIDVRSGSPGPSILNGGAGQHRNVFKNARAHVAFDLPAVKTKKRSDFVLLPRGAFKPWWDTLVVLLVIYSAFGLPVVLCFDAASASSRVQAWDLFVDVVFYLDVIFYFFTAYDQNGVTVFSRRRIAIHYLKSWFVVDLVACLPWEQLSTAVVSGRGSGVIVSVLRGCKALRLLRLSRLFKFLESHQLVSHAMRMVRLLFFFFLFAHWIACIWFAIGSYHSNHTDGLEGWLSGLSPPLDPKISPFSELYITSLYWVFTTWITVGYGDVLPKTDLEKCFAMLTMIVGAVIYATIFGNVAVLLQSLGRLDNIFKEKMENIQFYMEDLCLPSSLQTRVRNYYTFLWARHKSFSSSNQLEDLPQSLTDQIAHFLHQDTIEKCSLFKDAEPGFLRAVTTRLKFCVSLPGDFIFHEDDAGDKIYFLRKGRIQIENEEYGLLCVLEEGAYLGEISLILPSSGGTGSGNGSPHGSTSNLFSSKSPSGSGGGTGEEKDDIAIAASPDHAHLRRKRTASAKSMVNSDMYFLLREEFLSILGLYPAYAALFLEIARSRLKQNKVHSDEVLVEKILESHAKKGWLKLKGLNKPRGTTAASGVPASRRKMSSSMVIAAMNRPSVSRLKPPQSPSGSTVAAGVGVDGENPASSSSSGPGSSSAVSVPRGLGMKGMLLLAAAAEHKKQLKDGTIPARPPSDTPIPSPSVASPSTSSSSPPLPSLVSPSITITDEFNKSEEAKK